MVKCKVCGKEFAKLTWKHLRTHKMTVEEYRKFYGGPAPVSVTPNTILDGLAKWAQEGTIPDSVRNLVDRLYEDPQTRLKMILMAVAIQSLTRLASLQGIVDLVSSKIFSAERINDPRTSLNDLIKIFNAASTEIKNITDLFKDISLEPVKSGTAYIDEVNLNFSELPQDPKKRAEIYEVITNVLNALEGKVNKDKQLSSPEKEQKK